ncbi:hypothetical protein [Flavobacterium orientale]|uniref:Uncharacterized protein n=1 Tax=Flavobacterium orientale TaxID=1756020 RepID=A0A917DB91_9FLAO|nr:hypothetical protein [Flavobacterium orientale]GGD20564.1 hypothetical protein GCM10011343_08840 [Flavobacterium orientale]
MNKNLAVFLASILVMSPLFGLLLYFFEKELTSKQIVFQSLFFGVFMALGEIFIFERIRNKSKKNKNKEDINE